MNVGASSNIHQSTTSFFPGLEVGRGLGESRGREGGRERKRKVFGLCSLFSEVRNSLMVRGNHILHF